MNRSPSDEAPTDVERVLLAAPRGFCAGVEMAIKALAWMVRAFDGPVYCYHEIVHNQQVVRRFQDQGVVFVDDVAEVPPGRPLMLSAHGSAPEVSRAVSIVAANAGVREELRTRQRLWALQRGGGVIEGRDIGTVVFPDAVLKVYLTADPEVRARRRSKEMTDLEYDHVAADIARRDAADQGRDDSPLREADDAVVVDTTGMTIDQVVTELAAMVEART